MVTTLAVSPLSMREGGLGSRAGRRSARPPGHIPMGTGTWEARRRELLPLFRRGAAEHAFQGYEAQLERLESEPGVRQQL